MSTSRSEYDQVLSVFRTVDGQNSGTISLEELEAIFKKLDPAMPVTDLAKSSGACVVRYAEFLKYIFQSSAVSTLKLQNAVKPPEPGEPSSLEESATDTDIAVVCRSRGGTVLRKQSMLKCDHFPSSSQLEKLIIGAPNFRQVEGLPVYGVAQPTLPGCAEVLDRVRLQSKNPKKILWINCREEPVLYINGRPFCVKDRGDPFGNLETTGISSEELMQKEILLKEEVFAEAKLYGGRILLHGEAKPTAEEIELAKSKGVPAMGGVYAFWEPLVEVVCIHEIYECLQQQYSELEFMRLPITDEQEFEEKDFEQLHDALKGANSSWCVICNCQMGRGRTTSAMVLTSLLWSNIDKSWKDSATLKPDDLVVDLAGDLVKRLANGKEASTWADKCISGSSHMQNLKAVALKKLKALSKSSKPKEVKAASHYLERYLLIILVAAYLLENAHGGPTFRSWLRSTHQKIGVYDILEKAHKHELK